MARKLQTILSDALSARLTHRALPDELQGFAEAEQASAAEFLIATGEIRAAETPAIALEPLPGDGGPRRMRVAIVNDDMPFLVDSIAGAIGARDIAIERIIHPVVQVMRDENGTLTAVDAAGDESGARRESMIYLEMDRADARDRRELIEDLNNVLANVRAATRDWRAMQAAVAHDAGTLDDTGGDGEGANLLRWFLDRHFTLLGHQRWSATDGADQASALGIMRLEQPVPILAERSRHLAVEWFQAGNKAPLLLKSSLISPVHRRVPLDLVVVPVMQAGRVTGLSITAGLWTSAALNAPPRSVPVLRQRLAEFEAKFEFDPAGHTG